MDRQAVSWDDSVAERLREAEALAERRGLRVLRITTRATGAPPSLHLKYSHPLIEAGDRDAVTLSDGSTLDL